MKAHGPVVDASTLDPSTFLQLQEEERQRLAHALMHGPGQTLANALMEVEYSLPLLKQDSQLAIAGLSALRDELRQGLAQLKNFVAELQPPLLEEMGLGPSIHQYLIKFRELTGMRTECRGCDKFHARYPMTIEITLFRILQEALTNVQIHSKATRVRVELAQTRNHVQLTIQDNGRGFTPRQESFRNKRQLGLIAMRDRAELLGGQLQLFSQNGQGVRVVTTIPYHGHSTDSNPGGGQENHEHTDIKRARSFRAGTRTGKGQTGKNARNGKTTPCR